MSPRGFFFDDAIWWKVYLVNPAHKWMPAKPASELGLQTWSVDNYYGPTHLILVVNFVSALWEKFYLVN